MHTPRKTGCWYAFNASLLHREKQTREMHPGEHVFFVHENYLARDSILQRKRTARDWRTCCSRHSATHFLCALWMRSLWRIDQSGLGRLCGSLCGGKHICNHNKPPPQQQQHTNSPAAVLSAETQHWVSRLINGIVCVQQCRYRFS